MIINITYTELLSVSDFLSSVSNRMSREQEECQCEEGDPVMTKMVLEGILMPVVGIFGLVGNGIAVLVLR